ncbi:hypothetical protein [Pontixanthobacter aquaemixtae]|uniref:Uncharacterized protein n=1 Tax=Pontixanthobacter aquaemixtae TaxID=1958940 RepID=A0A844ZVC2_9SPHN|nr:hypothetical protein [Pontixanthobacter aquaemixtae]MXO90896.1 hypothetical protein [Pontixanthobacter aquaemixtae]
MAISLANIKLGAGVVAVAIAVAGLQAYAQSSGAETRYELNVSGENITQAWSEDYYFEKTPTDAKSWRMRRASASDWVDLRQLSRSATAVYLEHPDKRIFILYAPLGSAVKELRVIEPQSGQRTLGTLSAYSRRPVALAGSGGAQNLRRICFDGGTFVQTGPTTWVERNSGGQTTFTFEETARTGEMISLNDRSRNVQIYFRPASAEILLGQNGGPAQHQWKITCTGLGPQPVARQTPAPRPQIAARPTTPQLPASRPTAPPRTVNVPPTAPATAPTPTSPPSPAGEEPNPIGPMDYAGFACPGNPGYRIQETTDGTWQQLGANGRAIATLLLQGRNEQMLHLFDGSSSKFHFVQIGSRTVSIRDLATGRNTVICSNLAGTTVAASPPQPLPTHSRPEPRIELAGGTALGNVKAFADQISGRECNIHEVVIPPFDTASQRAVAKHVQGVAQTYRGLLAFNHDVVGSDNSPGIFVSHSGSGSNRTWHSRKITNALKANIPGWRHPSAMQAIRDYVVVPNGDYAAFYHLTPNAPPRSLDRLWFSQSGAYNGLDAAGIGWNPKDGRFYVGVVQVEEHADGDIWLWRTEPVVSAKLEEARGFEFYGKIKNTKISSMGTNLLFDRTGKLFVLSTFAGTTLYDYINLAEVELPSQDAQAPSGGFSIPAKTIISSKSVGVTQRGEVTTIRPSFRWAGSVVIHEENDGATIVWAGRDVSQNFGRFNYSWEFCHQSIKLN